nr:unnamed protein product [Callosobruchus chinensis]
MSYDAWLVRHNQISLTEKEWGKNRKVYFDNFFTSVYLLEKLKAEGVLACGTIQQACPQNLTPD